MPTRHLHVVRHGEADAFGRLTETGDRQVELLGRRLSALPVDAVWHSPLPRAERSARLLGVHLPDAPVKEAPELTDHVPYVPDDMPPAYAGFFDGFGGEEAAEGRRLADALIARFARPAERETHEVLVTHAFQVAWLLRHALDAPPARWIGLNCGNTSLTTIQYRDGLPPAVVLFNDMGHLPADLRWTGFSSGVRP